MPRPSPPPDRAACESALGPDLTAALDELCELFGIPRGEWHTRPALARLFETAAFARAVEKLRADGETLEAARVTAAIRLGIESEDTPVSRLKRWQRVA